MVVSVYFPAFATISRTLKSTDYGFLKPWLLRNHGLCMFVVCFPAFATTIPTSKNAYSIWLESCNLVTYTVRFQMKPTTSDLLLC